MTAVAQAGGGRRHPVPDSGRMIVVVDDDAEMRQAVKRLLSAAGYRTMTFSSAEALLENETGASADCFIMDVHLPGMSGFELQQQMALRGATAPVIFVTAYDDLACREQAKAIGAVALFAKPFSAQPLLAAIAGALAPR